MYLADGNVLSEPTKRAPKQRVIDWLRDNEGDVAVNPIVLGEMQYGILRLPAGRQRMQLLTWFSDGPAHLPVFPLDGKTSEIWADLLVRLARKGRTMPVTDSLIAATAIQHQLTLATRNVRDFQHTGARLFDPFAE